MKLKIPWERILLGRQRGSRRSRNNRWVEPPQLEGQLWFGNLWVAELHRMSPHQGTWFSEYDLRITGDQGEREARLLEYIAFCEEFFRRIAEDRDHDFAEFDRFTPIPDCKSWHVKLQNGISVPMEGRIWFADGTASWQHPETEPSTEAAACEFWIGNASKK